jgi:hypothetical protein
VQQTTGGTPRRVIETDPAVLLPTAREHEDLDRDRESMDGVESLKAKLRGQLLQPDDPGFDAARQVYNGIVDKRPRFIVRCSDVADVIAAVNFGRDANIIVSIRGGGHSASGLGLCNDGLVIDLSTMRGTYVDPVAKTARVAGGCTLGDVDHASHPFGLAVPTGVISTTGIAGLCLGGGSGHLTRAFGLTIDSLLECTIVLADGSCVIASKDQNDDLFWALRGGGGNFGVVTSLLFQLHPVGLVYGGPMFWEMQDAKKVIKWFQDFITDAPHDTNGAIAIGAVPPGPPFPERYHGKTMLGIVWCHTGPSALAEEVFKPIRASFPPAIDVVSFLPYPDLQRMFDAVLPPGLSWYWKGHLLRELSDDGIDALTRVGSQLPTELSGLHVYAINGAAHKVSKDATAWSHRDVMWSALVFGVDPDGSKFDSLKSWVQERWTDLSPYAASGAYVNFLMEEGQRRVEASYGDSYERLSTIKGKYDPGNIFRVNQNVLPSFVERDKAKEQ